MKLNLILSGLALSVISLAPLSAQAADATIPAALAAQADLKAVTKLVAQADADALNGAAVTLFAVSDEAFAKLSDADKTAVQASADSAKAFVLSHTSAAKVTTETLKTAASVTTADGKSVAVQYDAASNTVTLNGSVKIVREIPVSNGTIFVIDGVLTGK